MVESRLREHRAEKLHSRRALIKGGLVASAGVVTVVSSAVLLRLRRPLDSDIVRIKPDTNQADPTIEAHPQVREKLSLQIFKNFYSLCVRTEHDPDFWSSLGVFIHTAPEGELKKYTQGDVTGSDGSLHIWWPQDTQASKKGKPTVVFQSVYGKEGGIPQSLMTLDMRLALDGKVNNLREDPLPPEKIMKTHTQMKGLLSLVFNIDGLMVPAGWATTYTRGCMFVEKTIRTGSETVYVSMDETGYARFSRKLAAPLRTLPPPPQKEA